MVFIPQARVINRRVAAQVIGAAVLREAVHKPRY